MYLRAWRLIVLVLAALAMTMESAHLLELPQKMQYDAALYTAVNATLYRYFAIVGGVYQVGSIAAAGILAFLVHGRRSSFAWTVSGAILLLAAFGVWLAVVAPVNAEVRVAAQDAADTVPALWMTLRARWEYGHAAGFVLQLAGLCALVVSVLVETPDESRRGPEPDRVRDSAKPRGRKPKGAKPWRDTASRPPRRCARRCASASAGRCAAGARARR